jgi:hypothetical protein
LRLRDRNVGVEISESCLAFGHEALARKLQHRGDDAQIAHVAGADLAIHHHAARRGKVDHSQDPTRV